ncbi:Acyl transferase/acyl hydrolase/lysophospholipase [Penicillium cataractarum]|uniref:Acyl transferase/acyl hydrolase/lysophospholipase n=1 Tax=Penicillium cataractarum TaxID=2100454 RepID=A0A9X0B5N4_9EURO|nr:Acyl transferase/acyl hydrolase/lysophospholipase [Penicillium cataractarum]KAJ5388986.1 Acyl transferase/acyl hydrolase/lysophospholipase [Penicillium cataractarum]
MASSTTRAARPVCVLFGPQSSAIAESLSFIHTTLQNTPSLKFLEAVLEELPSLWLVLTDTWPALSQVPGAEQLEVLGRLGQGERVTSPNVALNVILTPVTVLRQMIEYWTDRKGLDNHRIIDSQGFCVGFLAAAAVSFSHGTDDFPAIASVMVRLAVCIGAAVDLDALEHGHTQSVAVRWKGEAENEKLKQILLGSDTGYISCYTDTNSATISVADAELPDVMEQLKSQDLSAKTIHLGGRFHHTAHTTSVTYLKRLCEVDARFRLPDTMIRCYLPLRSNVDGNVIQDLASIHEIALESILVKPSLWSLTVSSALEKAQEMGEQPEVIAIGTDQFVPRLFKPRLVEPARSSSPNPGKYCGNSNKPNSGHRTSENSKHEQKNALTAVPIAITGMGCRFAQADSPACLWEMLQLGRCAVGPLPNSRFKMEELLREPKGPFFGNYLANPDVFDHRFFGISAREAEAMDPQQRLLLQVAYEAMESAGYCGLKKADLPTDIGCYVGVGSDDYTENVGSVNANAFSATGTLQAFNTGRISHFFGWSGPSIVVDTACSSAAVSIHMACKALETKDCSIAVAGGVNVMTSPRVTQNLAAASFLSPTGSSKAFDRDADGYCRGEGAGLVVLRPLADALRNGDPILAVISGSAVNQGANCSPITVPHSESQISLYQKAMAAAGVCPENVTYVEAHGTGTQVGDPIEFDSLRRTFSLPARTQKLYIGSIKDNIGHTETASGVAGLLKTIMMMQNGQIPKQANFSQLNPSIPPFGNELIDIPRQLTEWPSAVSSKAVAMVTNYGAAGSNAAIVIEQRAESFSSPHQTSLHPSEVPVILAANSADSLRSYCETLISYLRHGQKHDCVDLAYNLAIKQSRDLEYTNAFTVPSSDVTALLAKLGSLSQESRVTKRQNSSRLPVILCFGGQNGDAAHISEELFNRCELLQYHLMECERACQALDLPGLFPRIFDPSPIDDIVTLHCILFAIQYSSAKSWLDSGLKVDRIIGHSFGQLTGLCVSGGLELHDAILLVSERARLIRDEWGPARGVMLSVEATNAEVQTLLSNGQDITVDIACVNGPRNIILASDEESIRAFEELVAQRATYPIRTRRLKNTHAFHSRLVDSIVPGLTKVAHDIRFHPSLIPLEPCSASGDWSPVTPDAIVAHSRHQVHFQAAVERAVLKVQGPAVWLEAGSTSPIIPMIRRVVEASASTAHAHVYQSIDLEGPLAQRNLSQATCNLWNNGVPVQFWPFHTVQGKSFKWVNLPPYQFSQNRHWIDFNPYAFSPVQGEKSVAGPTQDSPPPFIQLVSKTATESLCAINTKDALYQMCTSGHAVVDQNLCPASLYIEMVVRAVHLASPGSTSSPQMPHVQDLEISAPLVLSPSGNVLLKLSQKSSDRVPYSFSLFTRNDKGTVLTHAAGKISLHPFDRPDPLFARLNSMNRLIDTDRVQSIENSHMSSGLKGLAVYQAFRRVVNYAEFYRGVESVYATENEAAGVVNLASSPTSHSRCDPILMDNFIQVAGLHVNCLSDVREGEVFVCTEIGEFLIAEPFVSRDVASSNPWTIYSNVERSSKNKITSDVFVIDRTTGKLAVAILAVGFKSLSIASLTRALKGLNSQPVDQRRDLKSSTLCKETDHEILQSANEPAPSAPLEVLSRHDYFVDIQTMLCDLLGMPAEDLPPSSNLEEIGVDSLMRTEVLAEITKRFNVSMTSSELAEIPNVQSLVDTVFPAGSTSDSAGAYHPTSQSEASDRSSSGYDDSTIPTPVSMESSHGLISTAPLVFSEIQTTMAHSKATKWDGFYGSVYPKQMELVTAYVVEAFQSLGVALNDLQSGQSLPHLAVLPQHQQVLRQLYAILESSKLIRDTEAGFLRTDTPVSQVVSSQLHEDIVRLYPQHRSEHCLLKSTGSRLAECLTGAADPISLLFQNAEARQLMEDVYTNAPMFNAATRHLAQYLTGLLGRVDTLHQVKILEIGAGTGGTTKALLDQLTAVPGLRFEYTFTDLSSSLLALARKKFKHFNFMKYQTLNVEQTPGAEMLGQYDIIISSNCVHATRNLVESCTNIRKLLRPDGVLCLIELTRNIFWFDLVFGLLEGWWLFNDGRKHALATENFWKDTLSQSGFQWVDWSYNSSQESNTLRLITASPTPALSLNKGVESTALLPERETVVFGEESGVQLCADIFYPKSIQPPGSTRPIALMIHGGGHVMLSRRDVRPKQIKLLLEAGFLPVSIDYRLCPEVTLLEGPMHDVREGLRWARYTLPSLALDRSDVHPDGDQVVAVGWSTGGHLAMTLAWTAPQAAIPPPEAVLAFYCPSDYEDPFWSKPNYPYGEDSSSVGTVYDTCDGMSEIPITAYNPPATKNAQGGWMSPSDARSRIALHMNWTGQTVPVLLRGKHHLESCKPSGAEEALPDPTIEEVHSISPLAQIRRGYYKSPTFLIHGSLDDLIPLEQAQRTRDEMQSQGIEAELRVVENGLHLFDIYPRYEEDREACQAVLDGYEFLRSHVQL